MRSSDFRAYGREQKGIDFFKNLAAKARINFPYVYNENLTLVLLSRDIPCFANSVDSDQLASSEANWSGSALFAINYLNLKQ